MTAIRSMAARLRKYIDIGANLTDLMYLGIYNGKIENPYHTSDLPQVLERAWTSGVEKIIITGGSLSESKKALELAETNERLYSTVGCHPTRCSEFLDPETTPEKYFDDLKQILLQSETKNKIVAIGECGLDYERLNFCPKDVQKQFFEKQLALAKMFNLPLFLHCRKAADDLHEILTRNTDCNLRGVVHSFDGTYEEAQKFLDLGYYIGLNGCSIKTNENLETVTKLPSNRILLETDCPWCDVRPTHAGYKYVTEENRAIKSVKKEKWTSDCMVKGRNEPRNITMVLDVVAGVRQEDSLTLSEIIYKNTMDLFLFNEK